MIDYRKMWGFICSELIPGIFLTFGLFMLIDIFSDGALQYASLDSTLIIFGILISSIVLGISMSAIVFPISSFITDIIFEKILKIKTKKRSRNVLDLNIETLKSMFFNMIIPSIIIGLSFPDFIECPELQPNFTYVFIVAAFVFFLLGLLHEKFYRDGTGFSLM
ncbi:MAG: hypothetical protein KKB81_01585 [Candidatus Margulisbacteria bacterium]|nr:hypothetical protein [Candidatus Margulisiibacteriota bacterium]MBU1021607.1 hypothetical protein [Candidatus Margulisiibacteriota bacterium]MBU1728758.1 hypothetical protein [Candidatus Margulisiibacteriota bacterium]MBU1955724.1 hypothetical protein [Candidatus Margulisiibacteriota bacterium]